jgi:hypothetical protein
MTSNAPFLAQLCGPAKPQEPLPPLVAGDDGLLRRPGATTPFIDELQAGAAASESYLGTIVTKGDDSPDPDVVRASWHRMMATDIQKFLPDPDLIRHAACRDPL